MPFANNSGVKIHYEVEGQGPPLILHHGFSGTWKTWAERGYAQELGKDYRLIMLDARGHGSSGKPRVEKDYDYRLMVSDLVTILDDLKIQQASYFGYSMGGMVGFRIPIYAPGRFNSLILGGAAYPVLGTEDVEDSSTIAIQRRLEMAFKEAPDMPMEAYLADMEKQSGRRVPEVRASILSNDPQALIVANSAFQHATGPKWDELLPHITMPCLLFAGEADPRCSTARECARRMPNATFFSLAGLNHGQTVQRSELTLPHIKKFLAGVNN